MINGKPTVTGGAGNSQWSVNGTASIYTGTGSEFMTLGATANLAITGTNDFFQLNTNGGTATWNTINAGTPVVGSLSGGALSMQVYSGAANITTSSGGDGVVLHLDEGDANVRSLGADTIYAGAGYDNIIVSGAAQIYAGTGRLEVYGRSDSVGADVYGNGGDYLISGDTGNITYHGGDKASTVEASYHNITLIGGAGLMTINGGSCDNVVGGAGGIIYHDFGGGANTVTTLAGSTNLLEVSGTDLINSYGNDTISHSDGNTTINIYGNSSLMMGDGNSQVYLAGNDTVTVAPTTRQQQLVHGRPRRQRVVQRLQQQLDPRRRCHGDRFCRQLQRPWRPPLSRRGLRRRCRPVYRPDRGHKRDHRGLKPGRHHRRRPGVDQEQGSGHHPSRCRGGQCPGVGPTVPRSGPDQELPRSAAATGRAATLPPSMEVAGRYP